jgi:hypothetical protein
VKLMSGDPQWRHFTALDEYYQNGPLPTWIGWYVEHLPHWFHAACTYATLSMELGIVWMMFLPRRWRLACFFIVSLWQIPVILTANYTFLNYLVLALGILLADDRFVLSRLPAAWKDRFMASGPSGALTREEKGWRATIRPPWKALKLGAASLMLFWIFYATTALMVPTYPLPMFPIVALEPFRIANRYGLFAVMTRGRYEIEFQGASDGVNWVAYPFRYKPQALNEPPRIYAPYQPRFDWNLWFASLGWWRENAIVPNTEMRLLSNDKDVLGLFAANPFAGAPPRQIRVLLWQYWFTTMAEKRATGMWWKRTLLGRFAPTVERTPAGEVQVIEPATVPPRE